MVMVRVKHVLRMFLWESSVATLVLVLRVLFVILRRKNVHLVQVQAQVQALVIVLPVRNQPQFVTHPRAYVIVLGRVQKEQETVATIIANVIQV